MVLSELRQQPHLSASSIGEYVECSLLYRFGRIDRLPMEFKAEALEFGTCIHRVLEQFYSAKMIGEKMLLKDVHQIFEIDVTDLKASHKKYKEKETFVSLHLFIWVYISFFNWVI